MIAPLPISIQTVSIPNGMEFYRRWTIIANYEMSFNSQRDGILRYVRFANGSVHRGFNSQRDGILHFTIGITSSTLSFQFPTGWNSTLPTAFIMSSRRSFNSQRDGILQKYSPGDYGTLQVSIPNGMEFYVEGHRGYITSTSFNSQRDGILRGIRFAPINKFSFNSQRDGILRYLWEIYIRCV